MTGSMAQMTPLEERLSAALAARAHQVDESDLAPAEVPEPHRRNRGLIILAAAACTALVIGVPYGIAQLDGTEKPQLPATSTSPTPTPSVQDGSDWPVQSVGRIDLDGDGTEDVVQLRVDPTPRLNPMGYVRVRVEVALPSGTVFAMLGDGSEYHLEGAVDIPGSPGEEQLVSVGTSLRVLDLVDGQLRVLDAPDDPPLMRRTDKQGRDVTWFADSTGLYSLRSSEPVTVVEVHETEYEVDRWRWHIKDGRLEAAGPQHWCAWTDAPTEVTLCQAPPALDWPLNPSMFAPDPLYFAGVGTKFSFDVSEPGNGSAEGHLEESGGRFELVVTAGGQTWRGSVPEGGTPELTPRQVLTSVIGTSGFLVRQRTADGWTWTAFAFLNGDLVPLTPTSEFIHPGSGRTSDGKPYVSWVQRGWIFTAVGDGPDKVVYRWELEGDHYLLDSLGSYCFDEAGTAPCE